MIKDDCYVVDVWKAPRGVLKKDKEARFLIYSLKYKQFSRAGGFITRKKKQSS